MKTTTLFLLGIFAIGACLALAACGTSANGAPPPAEPTPDEVGPGETPAPPDTATGAPSTQLANPASVNCEKKGGKVEIREEPAGQFGVCVFSDGSRCEEWRFFRDECKPGECRADDGKCEPKNN